MSNTPFNDAIAWTDESRRIAFENWLGGLANAHGLIPSTLRAASSDASFRRYFRVDSKPVAGATPIADAKPIAAAKASTFIVMDAPPPLEDVRPFIAVASLLQSSGLNAPRVLAQDVAHGFLLLTDLGSQLYLSALQQAVANDDAARRDFLMRDAIAALIQWQTHADASSLPPYDDALLRRELALFPEWCVRLECGVTWTPEESQQWLEACNLLVNSALAQPTVAVHRDYMPRNLMVCEAEADADADGDANPDANLAGSSARRATIFNPGILDFQDAVRGPITYDVASLLRDAFISWDEEQEIDWAVRYWEAARKVSLPVPGDFGEFWRQVEWMGLQRHLKVLGIFCRLKHRDSKPKYSEDLPRFFAYAHKTAARYNALRPLSRLLEPLMGAERIETFY